ncbi:unnamed protein product [Ectocarpus fasciculatus]
MPPKPSNYTKFKSPHAPPFHKGNKGQTPNASKQSEPNKANRKHKKQQQQQQQPSSYFYLNCGSHRPARYHVGRTSCCILPHPAAAAAAGAACTTKYRREQRTQRFLHYFAPKRPISTLSQAMPPSQQHPTETNTHLSHTTHNTQDMVRKKGAPARAPLLQYYNERRELVIPSKANDRFDSCIMGKPIDIPFHEFAANPQHSSPPWKERTLRPTLVSERNSRRTIYMMLRCRTRN